MPKFAIIKLLATKFLLIMDLNPIESHKSTAKDFFLTLSLTVVLYLVIGSFLKVIFAVINHSYPPALNQYSYFMNSGLGDISFAIASLIILYPVYLGLSYLNLQLLKADTTRINLGVRKWLSYLTLFVAGAVIVGDLVFILYAYLDGQEITTAFLLKSLAVIITAIVVISYYYQSQKSILGLKTNLVYVAISSILIVLAIGTAFATFGSPRHQRLSRFDNLRSQHLSSINSSVTEYWRINGQLPASLTEIKQKQPYSQIETDPETEAEYSYQKTSDLTYKLCAKFGTDTTTAPNDKRTYYNDSQKFYKHPAGDYCIDHSINPKINPTYPTVKPVVY